MKNKILLLIFLLFSMDIFAQMNAETQKTLNRQIDFINYATEEMQSMVKSFQNFYDELKRAKESKSKPWLRYTCPHQFNEYYYNEALKGNTNIEKVPLENLRKALEKVDEKCKEIEVYIRLKDYEKDKLENGFQFVKDIENLVVIFKVSKEDYEKKLNEKYQKLKGNTANPAYLKCEKNMRLLLEKDKKLIDLLCYNFNDEIHTGWQKEEVQKNINETAIFLGEIQKSTPKISYPASHYYSAFMSCIADLQQAKKNAIDTYTFEAKKSDKHANEFYGNLINYYDGCSVSFFNNFCDFTQSGGLFPIKVSKISPIFKLKTEAVENKINVKFFADIPYQSFEVKSQNSAITQIANTTLNKFVEFIDEGVRINSHLLTSLMNSSLLLTSYQYEKHLYFSNSSYEIPHSLYQETILANKNLPETYRKSISSQAEVLLNIMKEMDELREELSQYTGNETYKKDNFKRIEGIRDRYKILFETFDSYKERFYMDLRKIFDSYKFANPQNSWVLSYLSLSEIVHNDREILFDVKKYYTKETNAPTVSTEKVAVSIRKSLSNEFANMKGIEKYGRSHGLCPYTPYEDIGTTSQQFSEYPAQIAKKEYENFTYLYNNIIDDYNKFVDLAKTPLLKNTKQPSLLIIKEPYKRQTVSPQKEEIISKIVEKKDDKNELKSETQKELNQPITLRNERVERDTIRLEVVKKETVIIQEVIKRDTVYIRDTIYLEKPPIITKDFYTLEGYAPNNLIFLLDISTSMNTAEKLPLLQESIKKLVSLLRDEDDISIVVYSGTAHIALSPTSGKDKQKIIKVIDGLESRGQTDANAGLALAYKVANQKYKYGGNNRIVLATDGEFGLRTVIMDMIEQNANAGISLTIFKFGEKPTPNLKQISNKGKGNLVSINEKNATIFMVQEAKVKK